MRFFFAIFHKNKYTAYTIDSIICYFCFVGHAHTYTWYYSYIINQFNSSKIKQNKTNSKKKIFNENTLAKYQTSKSKEIVTLGRQFFCLCVKTHNLFVLTFLHTKHKNKRRRRRRGKRRRWRQTYAQRTCDWCKHISVNLHTRTHSVAQWIYSYSYAYIKSMHNTPYILKW